MRQLWKTETFARINLVKSFLGDREQSIHLNNTEMNPCLLSIVTVVKNSNHYI